MGMLHVFCVASGPHLATVHAAVAPVEEWEGLFEYQGPYIFYWTVGLIMSIIVDIYRFSIHLG